MRYLSLILLLILGITTRFLPHPANFTAIGAIAIFGGLYLPRRWAIAGPMLAMFVSDIFIGFYSAPMMAAVYGSFALMAFIGLRARQNKNTATVVGGTLLGSALFFLITNWAVWAFGTMYAHNISGLIQSYTMAIPFFKNSLAADLVYTTVLAGGYELMSLRARRARQSQRITETDGIASSLRSSQ